MSGTRPASVRGEPLRLLLHVAGVALIAIFLVAFAARNVTLQWDLKTYVAAARAALDGLDPYRLENLLNAGRPVPLPFLYPPIALVPFLPLTTVPIATALSLWMGVKVAILLALVVAWRRYVPEAGLLPIALLAVFGWNGAALWDLRAGNVALIEAALLWAGFACYVAGRRNAFAALVVIAACFKVTPAFFLLLLLVPLGHVPPSPTRMFGSLAALAVLTMGPLMLGPGARWDGFLRHVPAATGLGDANPSAFELASTLVKSWGATEALALRLTVVAWLAYVLVLLALSQQFLRRAWRDRDPARWVMIAVFLELLIAPRPMAYGFVRLGPAPLVLLPEPYRRPTVMLLLAAILSAHGLSRAFNLQPASALVTFAPFLLTLAVWLFIARSEPRTGRP